MRVFAKALGGVPSARIESLLDFVGLKTRARSRFRTYSTGMKQRLSLACALLTDPELILLVEPTVGLNPPRYVISKNLVPRSLKPVQ